ncbi:MAG: hypothetical protein U0325_15525 [Polyangiales bacterium]
MPLLDAVLKHREGRAHGGEAVGQVVAVIARDLAGEERAVVIAAERVLRGLRRERLATLLGIAIVLREGRSHACLRC